jgi:hypothetical protein
MVGWLLVLDRGSGQIWPMFFPITLDSNAQKDTKEVRTLGEVFRGTQWSGAAAVCTWELHPGTPDKTQNVPATRW